MAKTSDGRRILDELLESDPELRAQVERELELRVEQRSRVMFIAKNVQQIRERLGMPQRVLAERLGVSQPAITKIEQGSLKDFSITQLYRLADALGVDITEIIGPFRSGSTPPTPKPADELPAPNIAGLAAHEA